MGPTRRTPQAPGAAAALTAGVPERADIVTGLQDLLAKEKQALHVENLLMDNIFVERLADKIVGKLGFVPGAPPARHFSPHFSAAT